MDTVAGPLPFCTQFKAMEIKIKLMGIFKDKTPAGGKIELQDGSTIDDALAAVGIPPNSAQVFTVNGQVARDRRLLLTPGAELTVLPPLGGG